jgi:hypothetical protein
VRQQTVCKELGSPEIEAVVNISAEEIDYASKAGHNLGCRSFVQLAVPNKLNDSGLLGGCMGDKRHHGNNIL